jgi:GntR family transcriptional repressor for pyruvate dehydrogenase complex
LATTFGPLNGTDTRSTEVARQFVDLLRDKKLSPGDRLPPERQLALTMGVSRTSLREGMRALVMLGVIEQRQGRGTFLARGLDGLPLEPYVLHLVLNRSHHRDLMELRRIVEPEVAALAATRVDEAGRALLEKSWHKYAEAVASSGSQVGAEADAGRRFHQTLAQLTNNSTLRSLLESLGELLEATGQSILSHHENVSFEAHRALYVAVRDGEADEARRIMREHLDVVDAELSDLD